jgi:hypothetical protein
MSIFWATSVCTNSGDTRLRYFQPSKWKSRAVEDLRAYAAHFGQDAVENGGINGQSFRQ